MIITVDPGSPDPPYEQICRAVRGSVEEGDLVPGTRLPTVRELAANLALAPNTVARAYRDLEAAGVVVTRGRRGTFVAPVTSPGEAAAAAYVRRVRRLGIDPDEALGLVRAALEQTP